MSETPEPRQVQFQAQAECGASQDYGSDWIAYALTAEVPSNVGGVDAGLNPALGGSDGGTAYA